MPVAAYYCSYYYNSSNTGLWLQSWSMGRNTDSNLQRRTLLEYPNKLVWSKKHTSFACCSALGTYATKLSMPHYTKKQRKNVEMKATKYKWSIGVFFFLPCSFPARICHIIFFFFSFQPHSLISVPSVCSKYHSCLFESWLLV